MTVLEQAQSLIKDRLGELDEEHNRLDRALAELSGGGQTKRRGRPPKAKATANSAGGRKRGRRGGGRADEARALVGRSPGISASEIAKTMKIKPNYLYRVLGDLEKEGRVKKQGREYFPV